MYIEHYLVCLLLICSFYPQSQLSAQTIERGPYLQLSTPNSVVIRWRTSNSTSSKVWYGTDINNLNQTATASGSQEDHTVKITGLNSSTKYYYRIGNNNGQYPPINANQYFKTHPSSTDYNQTIRAWMLGNAGTGDPEQETVRDAYYNVVGDEHIDMILFTGDNAYDDGKDSEYGELIFDMYQERLANTVSWSCFGNHDGGDADSEDESGTYYEVFDFPRNGEAGGLPTGTEAYFSFDYGNMHVVSLNTVDVDREPDGEMLTWLAADLAATEGKWKVVLLHHRPYTGSNNNDSDDDPKPTDVRQNFMPIMEAAGVDLVLSSHSHSYQRSYLINGHYGKSNTFDPDVHGVDMGDGQIDGDGAYNKIDSDIGTVYVVAGTAGQDDNDWDELDHPVMHYNSGSPGSVQLLVSENELLYQFINENEVVEDYFSILKGESTPASSFNITNPQNGSAFPPSQNITIATELSEEEMNETSEVQFYVDGNFIGTDNSFPYYQSWTTPASLGSYQINAIAYDASGTELYTSTVNVTVGGSQEICIPIATGSDDAEERGSGTISTTSGDLELVTDYSSQHIGLRFVDAGILPGASITEAYVQFTADEAVNIDPTDIQIYGELSSNPATFVKEDFNVSSRNKTNNAVSWIPPTWQNEGDNGPDQRTPNLAGILTEIINQPGYSANSPIAFIFNGIGKRVATSYDGEASEAAQLCISYEISPCADADNDGICDDNDPCPNGPEFGMACDDGDPSTFNDAVDENCNCIGEEGFCQNLQLPVGSPCNDNNSGTYNDVVDNDCNCVGTLYDCPLLQAEFGSPCNDNNAATYNDLINNNCECEGIPFDCPVFAANIGSPCDDGNPNTNNDLLDENCNCVGSLYDCASLEANIGDSCDDGNPLTENDVVNANCECVGVLLQVQTVSIPVATSSDDAEERGSGTISLTSSDLELMDDSENQVVGVRFVNTEIPAGAQITEAYIQFTVDETKNLDPCVIEITGEASNNAATFAKIDLNISSRPRTTASANWQPATWSATGAAGPAQRTSDLKNIVQEMIDRPGYSSDSPMAFILEGQGKRVAESYDGSTAGAPTLVVSYIYACEDDDGDGTCNGEDLCFGAEPGTPCDDNNSLTTNDVIDNNCNCIGVAPDCPSLQANFGDACNDGNPLTINDVVTTTCNCEGVVPGNSETLCISVAASDDDAEEDTSGKVSTGSSDLELLEDDDSQLVGMRFANLGLPQGAVIESAEIQFTADETNNIDPCQIAIFAEASDNAATFVGSNFELTNRPKTNSEVLWSPAMWTAKGAVGPAQRTIDFATVVQEVVNRTGFSENSSIVIFMDGTGKRVAESFDGGGLEQSPELCITYSTATPPIQNIVSNDEEQHNAADGRNANSDLVIASEGIKIYPNPTRGGINLSFQSEQATTVQLHIQNINGQSMKMESYVVEKGENVISLLDLRLTNGFYVAKLLVGEEWRSEKFVVVK